MQTISTIQVEAGPQPFQNTMTYLDNDSLDDLFGADMNFQSFGFNSADPGPSTGHIPGRELYC